MSRNELLGKYMRLRHELANAYSAAHWRTDLIDRLADEIARVELAIASALPPDEQTTDHVPYLSPYGRAGWAHSGDEGSHSAVRAG